MALTSELGNLQAFPDQVATGSFGSGPAYLANAETPVRDWRLFPRLRTEKTSAGRVRSTAPRQAGSGQ